jgi:hypothetical protein
MCPLVKNLEDCCVGQPRDEKEWEEDGIRKLKELYQLRREVKSMLIKKISRM